MLGDLLTALQFEGDVEMCRTGKWLDSEQNQRRTFYIAVAAQSVASDTGSIPGGLRFIFRDFI